MSALAVTALAILAWALIFTLILGLALARAGGKPTPTPPPNSLQARADAMREMGASVDEVFRDDYEPGPVHWRGGWRV